MYGKPPNKTKFKPGQSGNPNGRPKKLDIKDILQTIQKITALYEQSQSKDKTTRQSATTKIKEINNLLT